MISLIYLAIGLLAEGANRLADTVSGTACMIQRTAFRYFALRAGLGFCTGSIIPVMLACIAPDN